MRYRMKQRLFTLADSFIIQDHEGHPAFTVDGKLLAVGDQFVFRDMAGSELAQIKQKVMSWRATYEIHRDGKLAAVVEGVPLEHLRLHATFAISVPGARELVVAGDFWGLEYEVRRGERMVAKVSKEAFTWADAYEVQVMEKEDAVLALAIAVVIDMVCHPGRV